MNHPKQLLNDLGLNAKKSFGQNFLVDDSHLHGISSEVAKLCDEHKLVIEFGAGLGALTKSLLAHGLIVHAVERDRDLIAPLTKNLQKELDNETLFIHEANATTLSLIEVLPKGINKFVLCGNLPYHLTSTIMFRALEYTENLLGAVFLIQSEVAERIVAGPNNRTYGLLSVLLQSRFRVELTRRVPAGAFWPAPNVDSAVIRLVPLEMDSKSVDWLLLQTIAKAAFNQRRKTIKNALENLGDAEARLKAANINSKLRAENLSPTDFIRLTQHWKHDA